MLQARWETTILKAAIVQQLFHLICLHWDLKKRSAENISVQYLPWKPRWGALGFLSGGLCALCLWSHPLVPGHFLSRCLTVGYNTGQLKQHLEKTNYIRNRTWVFSWLGLSNSKFQAYGTQQATAAEHNSFLFQARFCVRDLSQNAEQSWWW